MKEEKSLFKETHAYRFWSRAVLLEREKLKILIHRIVHRSQIHLLFRRVDWNAPKKYNQMIDIKKAENIFEPRMKAAIFFLYAVS